MVEQGLTGDVLKPLDLQADSGLNPSQPACRFGDTTGVDNRNQRTKHANIKTKKIHTLPFAPRSKLSLSHASVVQTQLQACTNFVQLAPSFRSAHLVASDARIGSIASVCIEATNVRFSNRPFGVKHFQTIRRCSVDVARGLVLLFGIGTKALPSWDSKTRWNNLLDGLAVRLTAGPSGHANSPHPSSREGHHATARWSSSFLLLDLIASGFHAAAAACSRVHRNSVPSTQMRCMITANRRARATIAFFIPRRLAICIAQALSQDHFFERIMA